ncbi:uncharacterized protein DKFZp434B061-like [Prinia subflava]|uniref:uncharacterized protein DKFZp434B061-like n=1 Tax=Prinia subflava TaxID=208062 RepID=UPI002FE381F3
MGPTATERAPPDPQLHRGAERSPHGHSPPRAPPSSAQSEPGPPALPRSRPFPRPARCLYLRRERRAGWARRRLPGWGAVRSGGSRDGAQLPAQRPRSLRGRPRLASPQRRRAAHPPRDAPGAGRRAARRGRSRPGAPSRAVPWLGRSGYRLRGASPPCPAPAASSPARASPSSAPRVPLRSIQPPAPSRRSFVTPTAPSGGRTWVYFACWPKHSPFLLAADQCPLVCSTAALVSLEQLVAVAASLQCYISSDSSLVTPQGSAEVLQLPGTEQEV